MEFFLSWLRRGRGHVRETCTILGVPILTIFFRILEYSAIFLLHFVTVRLNICHDVGHLSSAEIELITNQVWRPPCVKVLHDAVECQSTTSNR